MSRLQTIVLGGFVLFGTLLIGCTQSASHDGPAASDAAQSAQEEQGHDGWWCGEHGVPEGICTRCHANLIAEFKAKNDWCKEHDLPESQCFVCHPEKEAVFAARYEARYGKTPPKPTDSGEGEAEHHDHEARS
jgi:cobalt-zinc-cadmium efflux system membrane fusion protein